MSFRDEFVYIVNDLSRKEIASIVGAAFLGATAVAGGLAYRDHYNQSAFACIDENDTIQPGKTVYINRCDKPVNAYVSFGLKDYILKSTGEQKPGGYMGTRKMIAPGEALGVTSKDAFDLNTAKTLDYNVCFAPQEPVTYKFFWKQCVPKEQYKPFFGG